ncbi:MAG: hypothetical protein AB7U73_11885 [Pirellulales bacterium]
MGRAGTFVMGFVVGGAVVFTTLKYHIVNTNQGFELVPKLTSGFSESYVDVRQFTPSDWNEHKSLVTAIVKADKSYILGDSTADHLRDAANDVLANLGFGEEKR